MDDSWSKTIFSLIKKLLRQRRIKHQVTLTGDPRIVHRDHHHVSRPDISNNALKVLNRLHEAGYQAYLVGGSVRDLLLRKAPKDFDVATDAKPEQIRRVFRNCRLIGKRFRLAHVHFGREIIEVATFRSSGEQGSQHSQVDQAGMIVRDNAYGNLEDDAYRRDFTVNALYYDNTDASIIDYTGGLEDLEQRRLRLIGDPSTRFSEDPVRILRAARFKAILDFTIEPETESAMFAFKDRLQNIAAARLFEEVLKSFGQGYAVNNFKTLIEYDLLNELFPIIQKTCGKSCFEQQLLPLMDVVLQNTDQRIANGKPVTPAFVYATLLWFPLQNKIEEMIEKGNEPLIALEMAMTKILAIQHRSTTIPKRLINVIREIWLLQYRLPKRYGKRAYRIVSHPRFRAAYDFLCLRAMAGDAEQALADWWTKFQDADSKTRTALVKQVSRKRKPND